MKRPENRMEREWRWLRVFLPICNVLLWVHLVIDRLGCAGYMCDMVFVYPQIPWLFLFQFLPFLPFWLTFVISVFFNSLVLYGFGCLLCLFYDFLLGDF